MCVSSRCDTVFNGAPACSRARSSTGRQLVGPGSTIAAPAAPCSSAAAIRFGRPRNWRSIHDTPAASRCAGLITGHGLYWRHRVMPHPDSSTVLASGARIVKETAHLNDGVRRLATGLQSVIACEELHRRRLDRAESFTRDIAGADGRGEVIGHRIGGAGTPPSPGDGETRSKLV